MLKGPPSPSSQRGSRSSSDDRQWPLIASLLRPLAISVAHLLLRETTNSQSSQDDFYEKVVSDSKHDLPESSNSSVSKRRNTFFTIVMPTSKALHEALSPREGRPVSVAEIKDLLVRQLMERDVHGRTPLFCALQNRDCLDVVQALIDACPAAILEPDQIGDLPVHYALRNNGSFEYARTMITANPACLKLGGDDGGLPMHVAVQRGVNVETFNLFLQGYPEACEMVDDKGRIPLQCALTYDEVSTRVDFNVIEALVRAFPDSLKAKDLLKHPNRCPIFPLHEICCQYLLTETFITFVKVTCPEVFLSRDKINRVPLQYLARQMDYDSPARQTLALAMIEACPEAAGVGDNDDHFPLHFFVGRANTSVIKAAVNAYPEAMVIRSGNGNWTHATPLQMLLHYTEKYSLPFVMSLVAALPGSVLGKRDADSKIKFPLNLAVCEPSVPVEVVRVLYQAWPDSVKLPDQGGYLPLTTAVESDASRETIEFLLEAYPEAARCKDRWGGMLPLHHAAHRPEVVDMLLAAYPEASSCKDNEGMLPLHHAVKRGSLDAARVLIEAWPDALKENNDVPLFLAFGHYSFNEDMAKLVLEAFPEAVRSCKNIVGDLLIHKFSRLSNAQYSMSWTEELARMRYLVEACPECLIDRDPEGNLPIHILLRRVLDGLTLLGGRRQNEALQVPALQFQLVLLFVSSCPDSLKEADSDGEIPLFHAFEGRDFNESVAKLLLDSWADSVKCTNPLGDLPIHKVSRLGGGAIERDLSEVFTRSKYLIDAWPESLLERNHYGDLPLHVLLSHMTDEEQLGRKRKRDDIVTGQLELVRLFVSKCPDSVDVVDGEGSIPLIIASQNDKVSLDVVDFLVKFSMHVLPTSRTGRFPA